MKNNFKISYKQGKIFSVLSEDFNKIHINEIVGYNSMFGQNICHGVLVIIMFLKLQKINFYKIKNFKITFFQPFFYENKIKIKKKQNRYFHFLLEQDGIVKAELIFSKSKTNFETKFIYPKRIKKISITKKLSKKFTDLNDTSSKLSIMLCLLTKYAGTFFPGDSSIIRKIEINFLQKNKTFLKNYASIKSKYRDNRLPIIQNSLNFKNLEVNFETIERANLSINLKKLSKKLKDKIKRFNAKIFILGASSGIGNDILKLFTINKKNKIFATFFKNSINQYFKNVTKVRFDIRKKRDLNQLIKTINNQNEKKIFIYYFCTPKISQKKFDKEKNKLYKSFYTQYPLSILRNTRSKNINFFFPSTDFINKKNNSDYSKEKFRAEKILIKKKPKNAVIRICRIPKINTKQNLEIISNNYPNFRDLLKNKYFLNSILFN